MTIKISKLAIIYTETAVVDHDKDEASSALPIWQDASIHKEVELK